MKSPWRHMYFYPYIYDWSVTDFCVAYGCNFHYLFNWTYNRTRVDTWLLIQKPHYFKIVNLINDSISMVENISWILNQGHF